MEEGGPEPDEDDVIADPDSGVSLDPEIKVEITRLYYERLGIDGHAQSQGALAKRFKVSASTINRAIKEALREGWVTIRVTRHLDLPKPDRDDKLARKLAARFDNVTNLFVLDVGKPPRSDDRYALWSDLAHQQTGRFLGNRIRHAIADNDSIGVSSGRGVHATICGLLEDELLIGAQGVSLLSLTGSFEMRGQSTRSSTVMDGDNLVGLLSQAFGYMTKLHNCSCTIVLEGPDDARPAWFQDVPNKALVGIGVVEGTNRLLFKNKALAPLAKDVDALNKLVREASREPYVPCADMCNFLFWVPPPKGIAAVHELEIRKLIERINDRLCAIPFGRLRDVSEGLWLAAASPRKANALLHALRSGIKVNALCVDATLAEALAKIA